MLPEDSYGQRKRLEFAIDVVERVRPVRVLDMGCGTGATLTRPLAERFPAIEMLGIDIDEASLARARAETCPGNLRFVPLEVLAEGDVFDLVIASEVLEHVDCPSAFLRTLVGATARGGTLIVTVPNGYGPFEWCAAFECVFHLSGLQALLRRLLRRPPPSDAQPNAATLAVSPHVNFFSFGAVTRLFATAGCEVTRYRPRTFLCGYGLDMLLRGRKAILWNARIADSLPPWCVSDWMFELRIEGEPRPSAWRRGPWGRSRRWLNRTRWGLA